MNKSIAILDKNYSFKIYSSTSDLPMSWDKLSSANIFLSKEYLKVIEKSAPNNMTCHFIGLFDSEELVGIAISQFLDTNKLDSYGNRDKCFKTNIRNFVFKLVCSHVLFIGNNMLTGENAYVLSSKLNTNDAIKILKKASEALKLIFKNKRTKVHIVAFKDFEAKNLVTFNKSGFSDFYQFSIQPNMVFDFPNYWKSDQDYIGTLTKKYRDQYKRARKKLIGVEKRKMDLNAIIKYEDVIYDLYFHVAKNAPFNTFYLAKNHFRVFKEILNDKFLFYGYFLNDQLIGFNTLIKNNTTFDTYFLGYDESIQKEKMLYLNMLYDMIGYSINKSYKEIIFGRTALEIKSSVGAKPIEMFGFIKHENKFFNLFMEFVFKYLEPKVDWKQRNPFN